MISNTKVGQVQKLYLKEFFTGFFNQRDFEQVVTAFSGGLQVLRDLVYQFENKYELCEQKMRDLSSNKKGHQSWQSRVNEINIGFQQIYHKLKRVLSQIQARIEKNENNLNESVASHSKSHRTKGGNQNDDDELYQMLNDYKNQCKRLKEYKKQSDLEVKELKNMIEKLEEMNGKQRVEISGLILSINTAHLKAQQYEQQIAALKNDICLLQYEKEELVRNVELKDKMAQEIIAGKERENSLVKQLMNEKEKNQKLKMKVTKFPELISENLREKQNWFKAMIDKKLTRQTIFEQASCSSLRQFVTNMKNM